MTISKTVAGLAIGLAFSLSGTAIAQDNPLLAPAGDNPLLQQNNSKQSKFEKQAAAIDAAATRSASDPVCQNIRANYDQQLAEIAGDSGDGGMSLGKLNGMNSKGNDTAYRLNRMGRNLGVDGGSTLGKAAGTLNRGTAVANDAAAIGSLFGIGKKSGKKAAKKAAKLDRQAMDAVKQVGCPMATFN